MTASPVLLQTLTAPRRSSFVRSQTSSTRGARRSFIGHGYKVTRLRGLGVRGCKVAGLQGCLCFMFTQQPSNPSNPETPETPLPVQFRQHVFRVLLRIDLLPDLLDPAVRTDPE